MKFFPFGSISSRLFCLTLWLLASSSATAQTPDPEAAPDNPPTPAAQAEPAQPAAAVPGFLGVGVDEAPAPAGLTFPSTVLVISAVHPGSPADLAGLRSGDTLLKLDDQWLVHPVQLQRLVADNPPATAAQITLRREGQSLILPVTLSAWPADLPRAQPVPAGPAPRLLRQDFFDLAPLQPGGPEIPNAFRQMQEQIEAQMHQMRERLNQLQPPGDPRLRLAPGPGGAASQSVILRDDGEHRLEITTHPQGRHLKAADAQGEVLFDGPIDTPEQLEAVPQEIRRKLPAIERHPTPVPDAPPVELAV
ncbi:MAG: PDZ domain-containing protein [Planctomycetota bacterium]